MHAWLSRFASMGVLSTWLGAPVGVGGGGRACGVTFHSRRPEPRQDGVSGCQGGKIPLTSHPNQYFSFSKSFPQIAILLWPSDGESTGDDPDRLTLCNLPTNKVLWTAIGIL